MSDQYAVFATVRAVRGEQITLAPQRPESCARCARGEGCGAGVLLRWWPARDWQLPRPPGMDDLKTGETVQISLPERRLLHASLILYGLPICCFVLVAVLAVQAGMGDAQTAMSAFFALGLGIAAARWQARRHVRVGMQIRRPDAGGGLCG